MKFDIVVANPPFSLDKWGAETAEADKYHRFHRGVPPKSKGDYAFISHMVETAVEGSGKVGVVAPHGVLFRGGAEGRIRKELIEENALEAVIGLPEKLFFGTGIPATIMIFNKGKKTKDVLFIDASRDFVEGTNQNKLGAEHIAKIVATYKTFKTVEKYAYRATPEEIAENDFNLNIPRYVDTFEPEKEVDLKTADTEVAQKKPAGKPANAPTLLRPGEQEVYPQDSGTQTQPNPPYPPGSPGPASTPGTDPGTPPHWVASL